MTGPVKGRPPSTPRFGIREFCAAFGVSRWTVRDYIKRGLLPRAEGHGAGAYYTGLHWQRMKAIRAAVGERATLDDLKERLG